MVCLVFFISIDLVIFSLRKFELRLYWCWSLSNVGNMVLCLNCNGDMFIVSVRLLVRLCLCYLVCCCVVLVRI